MDHRQRMLSSTDLPRSNRRDKTLTGAGDVAVDHTSTQINVWQNLASMPIQPRCSVRQAAHSQDVRPAAV